MRLCAPGQLGIQEVSCSSLTPPVLLGTGLQVMPKEVCNKVLKFLKIWSWSNSTVVGH